MTAAERKANARWQTDLQRYFALLSTMHRLGVLDEIHNYVSVTSPPASKYGEKALLARHYGGINRVPDVAESDLILASLAADIKAGIVNIPVVAAIIRVQIFWSDGSFSWDAMSMVDDYVRSYRDRIQRNYLDAPGGACYEPSQGGHAP